MTDKALTLKPTDFLTSDIQLFDEWLVKWRFSDSLENLHARTARIWDETVSDDATVLVLGDAIAYRPQEGLAWFDARPGQKVLITGNWDEINPMASSQPEVDVEGWREVFPEIYDRASVSIGDQQFLAMHYTYSNAEGTPALVEKGAAFRETSLPLLHGHTHSRKRFSRTAKGTLQMHVGWDAWKRPVTGQAILDRADQEGW